MTVEVADDVLPGGDTVVVVVSATGEETAVIRGAAAVERPCVAVEGVGEGEPLMVWMLLFLLEISLVLLGRIGILLVLLEWLVVSGIPREAAGLCGAPNDRRCTSPGEGGVVLVLLGIAGVPLVLLELAGVALLVLRFSVQSCLFDAVGQKFYSSVIERDVIIQALVTYSILVCHAYIREISTAPEDLS